jgi:HAD superfamily hydrolase (TIGR01549 family)
MADVGLIFDVDGVLLELTIAEEDIFFQAFEDLYGITGLSRDWDSYRIRNDEQIVAEILEAHRLPLSEASRFLTHYLMLLEVALAQDAVRSVPLPGAHNLLATLSRPASLGIATANFHGAARARLQHAGLWSLVAGHAHGAEGHGHKRETLASAIAAMQLPKDRIAYVGDNLNDFDAATSNGVAFIAFSADPSRRRILVQAGAQRVSADHAQTLTFLKHLFDLDKASKL